ncbi:uncharacterized protein N7483_005155 [Penicillium malachiteum]|uniref:uncharacterized protein n=1 Tax=Penicillium malachiteum TaxID=1324776 RepID=UPI002548CFC9|nr:uncharacterized protein N7483_005155 [Penicillium malachiteum]KAJ5730647.1 hypothetical protein N7483_005155 [Penicillium malachiteum]
MVNFEYSVSDAKLQLYLQTTYKDQNVSDAHIATAIARIKGETDDWEEESIGPIDYDRLLFEVWAIMVEKGAPGIMGVGEKLREKAIEFPDPRLEELTRVLPWLWKQARDDSSMCLDNSTRPAVERSRALKRTAITRFITEEAFNFDNLCRALEFDMATIPHFFPTEQDLEDERSFKAEAIFKAYHRLRKIMMHFEKDIGRRFQKRNEQKRRRIIQDAWNDSVISEEPKERRFLPKEHFPSFRAFSSDGLWEGKRKIEQDELFYTWILPSCINLHDLASKNPAVLQMLLHSRSHNAPDIFYFHDVSQIKFEEGDFLGAGGPPMPYETNFGMEFFGHKTPDKYGRLTTVEDVLVSRRGHCCSFGMILLDAQRRLYEFLLSICLKITQKDLATLDALPENPATPVEVDPESTAHGPDDLLSFRYPGRWEDIDAMIPELKARRDAAVSHLKALRNQPDYFGSYMIEEYNHVPEHSRLQKGGFAPERDTEELLKRSALMVVSDAFGKLMCWDKLHVLFIELKNELRTFQMSGIDNISVEDGLPDELRKSITFCDSFLSCHFTLFYRELSRLATCAPKFRHLAWIYPFTGHHVEPVLPRYPDWRPEGGTKYGICFRRGHFGEGTPTSKITKALFWSLNRFQLNRFQTQPVIELERDLLTSENQVLNEHLSRYIMEGLSDLAFVAVLQLQFTRFHPWTFFYKWGYERDESNPRRLKPKPSHLTAKGNPKSAIRNEILLIGKTMSSVAPLAACCDGAEFDYPIHRFADHNSKELTDTLQTAERALDNFWNELCSEEHKTVIDQITGGNRLPIPGFWPELDEDQFRTPDWVEPQAKNGRNGRNGRNGSKRSHETMEDLPIRTRTSPDEPAEKKVKTKTRGVPSRPTEQENEQEAEPEEAEPVMITLKTREYDLLELLFWVPSRPVGARELRYTEFLRFMTAIGFTTPANGMSTGSAVRFDPPEELARHGSIVIHAPHPEIFYSFGTARNIGNRLKNHYGLSRESFKLDERNT